MTRKNTRTSNEDDIGEYFNFSDRVYSDDECQYTYGHAAGVGRGPRADCFDHLNTRDGGNRGSYDNLSIPNDAGQYASGWARTSSSGRDSFNESRSFRDQYYESNNARCASTDRRHDPNPHTGPRGNDRPGYPDSFYHAGPYPRARGGQVRSAASDTFDEPFTSRYRGQDPQQDGNYASQSESTILGRGRRSDRAYSLSSRGRHYPDGQPYQASQGRRTSYHNSPDTSNDGVADYCVDIITEDCVDDFRELDYSNDYDTPHRPSYQSHGARDRDGSLSPLSSLHRGYHHYRL